MAVLSIIGSSCISSGLFLELGVPSLSHPAYLGFCTGLFSRSAAIPFQAGLDNCRFIGGVFDGTTCYPLYDKLLMSILLSLGTFALAITFKVTILRGRPLWEHRLLGT